MIKQIFDRTKLYLIGVGLIIVATLIGELLKFFPYFDPTSTAMIYLLCIAISAVYLGFWPSLMVCILGVSAFDLLFVLPLYTFAVENGQGAVNLLIMFVVGIAIVLLLTNRES